MNKTYTRRGRTGICTMCILLCLTMLFVPLLGSCNNSSEPEETKDVTAEPQKVEVLRVKTDIPKEAKITSSKFEVVTVDINETWIGAISDPEKVVGKYSLIDLKAGDYFIGSYISDKKPVQPVKRAEIEDHDFGFKELGYVVVTEYVTPNQGTDLYASLQKIIDTYQNKNHVIYFPDGEYLISEPLRIPADGSLSVCLKLSDNAVIKATDDWDRMQGAMIRLGGKNERNDIYIAGSNYYLEGGTIDGNGVADGVSIDHGRETSVRDVTIVNTKVGLHVKKGANGGSSDADIENVRIVGNGEIGSIGLYVQGWDNTFSNMRISNVHTGVAIETAANLLRDIQVTYVPNTRLSTLYDDTCGFRISGDRNWFDNCTSTGFSRGFVLGSRCKLTSCVVRWDDRFSGEKQVAVETSKLNCVIRSLVAEFSASKEKCEYLVSASGGVGAIYDPIFDESAVNGTVYREYLRTSKK